MAIAKHTDGVVAYWSKNKDLLQSTVFEGFHVPCVEDNRNYSYLPSRHGNTLRDTAAPCIQRNRPFSIILKNKNFGKDKKKILVLRPAIKHHLPLPLAMA